MPDNARFPVIVSDVSGAFRSLQRGARRVAARQRTGLVLSLMVAGGLGLGSVQAQTQVLPSGKVMEVQAADGTAGAGKASASREMAAKGQGIAQLRRFATRTPAGGGRGGSARSSGSFAFARPGNFRWEIDKPDPQLIVTDGKKLYFYDEGLRQVTVREASEAIQATPAAVLFGVGDLDEAFKLSEVGQYNGIAWVEAVPRSADSGFDRIRIGMRDGLPVVMEVVDAFGQINRFEFSKLSTNERIPAERFHFKVPAGVDVLE